MAFGGASRCNPFLLPAYHHVSFESDRSPNRALSPPISSKSSSGSSSGSGSSSSSSSTGTNIYQAATSAACLGNRDHVFFDTVPPRKAIGSCSSFLLHDSDSCTINIGCIDSRTCSDRLDTIVVRAAVGLRFQS
ncbi:hypothetical protein PHSY_005228 [Pseudozyma hubeiensis SY62]|uniref:Uncharacterized protein n=1 Tax=Pseudozyma hubeiensis (strain SY62) TaxID=1305764 RepID=R9P8Q8_PSEHS|nr:hypothetical protein PHSY_005228 [Pseudozyma hubeiensis SY62]GAC97642.1 hypothetical protein PHSY_005228 [Pseudozyma hubeiensis SY62]